MGATTRGHGGRPEARYELQRGASGEREAELADSLAQTTTPREVSYLSVAAGVVLVGALATLGLTSVAASPARTLLVELPDPPAAELRRARELYEAGAFAEARVAFDELARRADGPRVRDYLARLARVDGDAALIARARGRLALGDAEAAIAASREVAGNSPLWAEAWALGREAQAEQERAQRARVQTEREDARALEEAARRTLEEAEQADMRAREARRQRRRARRASVPD